MTVKVPFDDLLIALHAGMLEEDLWLRFLTLLKDATESDYVSLIFLQGDVPMHEATEIFVGRDVRTEGKHRGHQDLFSADPIHYQALKAGKVYAIDDIINWNDPRQAAFRTAYLERGGVRYSRYMRVGDPQVVSAWAIILRDSRDFGPAEERLLSDLAAHLTVAVSNFAAFENARFRSVMGEWALGRNNVCWAAFDRKACFLAADPRGERMLSELIGHAPVGGQRLMAIDPAVDRALIQASADFAKNAQLPPRVVHLGPSSDGSLVLLPFRSRPLTGLAIPAMMALWRAERPANGALRPETLADIFGFTKSEARFAMALLRGLTVNEAARELELSVLTARQYSKSLISKAKAKGQPDLMRIMLGKLPI